MPVDIKALRAERAKKVEDARALVNTAEAEKRELTDDENRQFGAFMDEAEKIAGKIQKEEQLRDAERAIASFHEAEEQEQRNKRDGEPDAYRGFQEWLQRGKVGGENGDAFRALSAGVNTEGGYLVAPEQFVNSLIKAVDDQVFIRGLATTYTVAQAASLGAPELKADPADADWTTELQTGSEDSTMSFGKRSLFPHPLAKRIKVSNNLLRQATMSAEQIVMDRLTYKFGITEEKAFMTGTGAGQPLGLFTASPDGISTARDVSAENTTTAITADNLRNVKYSVKAQYMMNGAWVFHRDALKMISKLKDGEGQYLWQPGISDADGDRLLGNRVYMSEYAPNTFTTGLYVGMFGDFSHYWIVDALNMQMQRLTELYAESNQTGFIARRELDGAPVLEEAFARVKLA